MDIRHAVDPVRYERMTSEEVRNAFLLDSLFVPDQTTLAYSMVDRAIVGSSVPVGRPLRLEASHEEMAAEYFAQRREIGVVNVGSKGVVAVDGKEYILENKDMLYVGRGSKEILFSSTDGNEPARFYFTSYPAHTEYPTVVIKRPDANALAMGSEENANKRTIFQYIHPDGIDSCQLVMGLTDLEEGSVWNTMPPHSHVRRSEIYMYFDLDKEALVFHLMGKSDEIRNIVVRNGQAVISPTWSFHSGVGIKNYSFVWSMGGENQAFDDMDHIALEDLR